MKFIKTKIKNLYIIEPEPFRDDRGKFCRIFCRSELETIRFNKRIVQINYSLIKHEGTIRRMHFQYPPKAENKFVRCI